MARSNRVVPQLKLDICFLLRYMMIRNEAKDG